MAWPAGSSARLHRFSRAVGSAAARDGEELDLAGSRPMIPSALTGGSAVGQPVASAVGLRPHTRGKVALATKARCTLSRTRFSFGFSSDRALLRSETAVRLV